MTTRPISDTQKPAELKTTRWLRIGLQAAVAATLAVLLAQAVVLALWPELAAFKPLNSYARSALFTIIPAMAATAVFAWLVKNREQPLVKFLWISAGVLLLSILPDYLLPLASRTIAGSTAAAFMHLVAAVVIVGMILAGYARSNKEGV